MNLVKLEMMNATERLAEALKARGIFCSIKNDLISMGCENTESDIFKVKVLLSELNIPILWLDEKRFQVLLDKLPISVMKKIMNHKGKSFPIHMEGYHYYWRAFAQRRFGIKVNALDLDANVAMFVKSLNLSGITSLAGCNGHYRYNPNVQLSGPYSGIWFEIVKEKFLCSLKLNYEWEVEYGTRSGAAIIARKKDEEKWDMNKIYQDTVLMAEELQRYSEAIRSLKKKSFQRNKRMARNAKLLEAKKDYNALKKWMTSCVDNNL